MRSTVVLGSFVSSSSMKKLNQFCREVYHPGVHLYFSLNWVLALYAGLCLNHGHALEFSPYLVVAVLTLYLSLLFLRIMDEIKDYDYDLRFNPERPLVKKSLSHRDLYLFILMSCSGFLALNVLNGVEVLMILGGQILYSFLLIVLEKNSERIRNSMLLNLLVTYPVNIALSVYVMALFYFQWSTDPLYEDLLLLLSFACAFLYYEFSRKISPTGDEAAGQRSYSKAWGLRRALILSDGLALTAILSMSYLTKSWVPLLLIAVLVMRANWVVKKKNLTLAGSAFIGLFYGAWMLIALLDYLDFHLHLLIRS